MAEYVDGHIASKTHKGVCTYPGCGRVTKSPRAHMLTHRSTRPEKCPVQTCEYHIGGFAREHDRNRHALAHYKGIMDRRLQETFNCRMSRLAPRRAQFCAMTVIELFVNSSATDSAAGAPDYQRDAARA